jgi:histidinol-phosphate aminotransferase
MFQLENILPRHSKKLLALRRLPASTCGQNRLNLADNSNHFGSVGTEQKHNSYPDADCCELKSELAANQQLNSNQVLATNGGNAALDLIFRAFISPDRDSVMIFNPAESYLKEMIILNSATVQELGLTAQFQLPVYKIRKEITEYTKIIIVSNPNPISGLTARPYDLVELLDSFNGLVVVDETYIDFCADKSMVKLVKDYPNLVVIQSFSKGYGLAALRLGAIFADEQVIKVLQIIQPAYSVSTVAQEFGKKALHVAEYKHRLSDLMRVERENLRKQLLSFGFVKEISHSEANFLLIKVDNAVKIYDYLQSERIDVYLCLSNQQHCEQSLRITIGTSEEIQKLLFALQQMPYKLSPIRNFIKAVTRNFSKAGSVLSIFKKIFS